MNFTNQVTKFQQRVEREVSERAAAIGSKLSAFGSVDRREWLLRHPQYPDLYIQCNDLEEAGRKLAMWERRAAA